jgi:hypothetical protein
MFANTRSSIDSLISEIKTFLYWVCLFLNLSYILIPIYAIVVESGILIINIAILIVSVVNFIYHILAKKDRKSKKTKKIIKRIRTVLNIIENAAMLAISVYAIYVSAENVDFVSILLVVTSFLCLIFNLLFLFVDLYIGRWKDIIFSSVKMDFGGILKAYDTANEFFSKVKGEAEPEKLFNVSEKMQTIISSKKDSFLKKLKDEKERKKAEKREKKTDRQKETITK